MSTFSSCRALSTGAEMAWRNRDEEPATTLLPSQHFGQSQQSKQHHRRISHRLVVPTFTFQLSPDSSQSTTAGLRVSPANHQSFYKIVDALFVRMLGSHQALPDFGYRTELRSNRAERWTKVKRARGNNESVANSPMMLLALL